MTEPERDRPTRIPFGGVVGWWRREVARLRSRWRRYAVRLLVLVIVLLVVRIAANLWIGHELNTEVSRLEQIYGRLDVSTLAPSEVFPSKNRARVMRAAASLLTGTDAHPGFPYGINPFGGVVIWGSPALDPSGQLKVTDEMRRLLANNQPAVQAAELARRRPQSNWQIDYVHDANYPGLLELRQLSNMLALSCRVDIEDGRSDRATEAALAGLAEAASLSQEPIIIVQLIRVAVAHGPFGCVRDLLELSEPSASQLAEVASALTENRTPDPVGSGLVGEMKHVNRVLSNVEMGTGANDFGPGPSPAWATSNGAVSWLARPLIRYARLRLLRGMDRLITRESVLPYTRPARQAAPDGSDQPKWWQLLRRFDAAMFGPGLARFAETGYEYQALLNAAEVSVALRRYRLDHGRYPGALGELAPSYLAHIPIDPFTGRPPEYERQGAGFVIRAHRAAGRPAHPLAEWKIPR